MSQQLWAITSYFNPQRYRRRLTNYRMFRDRLRLPLVTVELSFGAGFELGADDADVLIQLASPDVLWHKERLLNIALAHLPRECRHFAWLDCDLVFEESDWAERTRDLLDRFVLVEPFTDAYRVRSDAPSENLNRFQSERLQHSLAFCLATGAMGFDDLDQNTPTNAWTSGLAWAARRELFEPRGFYDACIMGSGSRAMACAALGQFDRAVRYLQMNVRWRNHYLSWARPYFELVRGGIGFADGAVFHLWHGDSRDRRYLERHQGFKEFDFDPTADLADNGDGCWRWNSDKIAMHRYVSDYFATRKEDGS